MRTDDISALRTSNGESIVRACITSIAGLNPFSGALVGAYLQHMDNQRWKNVEQLFTGISEQMEIHGEKLTELSKRTDPDEILHLMFIAIDNVQFEYKEARRTRYAELFVNSILLENEISYDEKRVFFQLFNELSEADIDLFGKFNNHDHIIDLESFRKIGVPDGFNLEQVVPLVIRLESRGLITEMLNAKNIKYWEGDIDSFDSIWRNKVYTLTPIGLKFSMFLKGNQ